MPSDLVKELRAASWLPPAWLFHEAAKRIEQLEAREAALFLAVPDYIDLFRIIRRAGKSDRAKAEAVHAHLQALKEQGDAE